MEDFLHSYLVPGEILVYKVGLYGESGAIYQIEDLLTVQYSCLCSPGALMSSQDLSNSSYFLCVCSSESEVLSSWLDR